ALWFTPRFMVISNANCPAKDFMEKTVLELAALVAGSVTGDENLIITGVASIENAGNGDIVFVESEKFFARALACPAAAIVAPTSLASNEKTLILVRHPKLAFARIVSALAPAPARATGIHPTAIIEADVLLAAGVFIGARAI